MNMKLSSGYSLSSPGGKDIKNGEEHDGDGRIELPLAAADTERFRKGGTKKAEKGGQKQQHTAVDKLKGRRQHQKPKDTRRHAKITEHPAYSENLLGLGLELPGVLL